MHFYPISQHCSALRILSVFSGLETDVMGRSLCRLGLDPFQYVERIIPTIFWVAVSALQSLQKKIIGRGCDAFCWIIVYNVWKNIVFVKINDFKVFKSAPTNTDSIEATFSSPPLERLLLAWAPALL